MSIGVVVDFEIIYIDHHKAKTMVIAPRTSQLPFGDSIKVAAIVYTRQAITYRTLLRLAQRYDQGKQQHHTAKQQHNHQRKRQGI